MTAAEEPGAPAPRMDAELYAVYRDEAEALVATLDAWCAAAERGDARTDDSGLRRAVHTLAGSSKMAGLAEIGNLMTLLEEVLTRASAADTGARDLVDHVRDAARLGAELVAAYGDARLPLPPWEEARERLSALRDALPPSEPDPAASENRSGEAEAGSGRATVASEPESPLQFRDPELLQLFTSEAVELLEAADAALRAWCADFTIAEPLSELLRRLHTLKGGARMAGIAPFADLVHDLESLFTRIAEGLVKVSPRRIGLGERALDELHRMLEHLNGGGRIPRADALRAELRNESAAYGEVSAAIRGEASATAEAEDPQEADLPRARDSLLGFARVRTDLLESSINNAGEIGIYRGRIGQQLNAMNLHLAELARTVERVRNQMRELEMEIEAQVLSVREQRKAANLAEFDPLEFDRYTHIHELSRSLSEAVADLTSLRSLFATGLRLAGTALDRQGRVNSELQDALLRTRMMPFALSEGRLRRVVRQVAEEAGKRVEFRFTDMGGEMDRLVLDHILPALEHLLRNAVVHGIESAQERRDRGKPEAGRIELSQRREGAETVVEVTDDGGGLDLGAIRSRAEQEGLAPAGASEQELVDLVFRLGFTTAGTLSQAAGRGVGMNVVAAEARYVGGSVEIVSHPGLGTRVALRLPATLAISHTLLIRVGARRYLVPLAGIGSLTRVPRTLLDARLRSENPSYEQGGESYDLVSLARVLGEPPLVTEHEPPRVPLLLIRAAGRRIAFVADDMEGSREVVVKPIGPQVAHLPGISGASFFDDGSIGLLLDLAGLVRAMPQLDSGIAEDQAPPAPSARSEALVMVADDSITVRRVTERVLARHGVRVLSARDGVEALELLADYTPKLLLLDIEMPRMNGYELVEHMRNDERLRAIPIIMITSRVGEKHRARAAALGIERYLGKPYLESELLAAIRSVVAGLDTPGGGRESAHGG